MHAVKNETDERVAAARRSLTNTLVSAGVQAVGKDTPSSPVVTGFGRADSARVTHPLFQAEEGGSTPTSALQLLFGVCSRETFRELNALWHSRLPLIGNSHGRVYYKAECDGVVYAVAMWSNPVARLLPQREWIELRRLAIAPDAPKNTASRMLGWMARDIKQRFPEVVRLVSYQDCEVHNGTIYKAAGWSVPPNYVSRARGWSKSKTGKGREGRTDQAVAPRMRWERAV
jgi:hypothetical protein